MATTLPTLSEWVILYEQLSEQGKNKLFAYLKNLVNQEKQSAEEKPMTLFEFFKNCDPAVADIELEIVPRKEQLSRRDFNFEEI